MSELARHVLNLDEAQAVARHRASVRAIAPDALAGDPRPGIYEVAHFSGSFAAVIGEFSMAQPLAVAPVPAEWMQWHYRIRGDVLLDSADAEPVRVVEASTALRAPSGAARQGWTYAGPDQCFLTLLMRPRFIEEILYCAAAADPSPLLDALTGGDGLLRLQSSAALSRAVCDVIRSPYEGQLRLLHLEAKALEVFCISVQDLRQRLEKQQPSVMLSQRDIARLGEVRAALVQHPTRWLTIRQLSRQFALNQRKLKEGFKHLFGDTVFQFAQEQRMIRARRLIEEDAMSIGHVSAAIGYESHASFTAAFKRHFGYLPRDVRVRGRTKRRALATKHAGKTERHTEAAATAAV